MVSDLHRDHRLEQAWSVIATGHSVSETSEIDSATLDAIRRFHATLHAPVPSSVRERGRNRMRHLIDQQVRERQEDVMTVSGTIPLPSAGHTSNGRRPAISPARPTIGRRLGFNAGIVANAAVTALLLFVVYRSWNNNVIPPLQETPAAVASPPPESSDWPLYRGNPGRTGSTRFTGPTQNFSIGWSQSLEGGVHGNPAIAGQMVFVPTEGSLVALDLSTGQTVWSAPLSSESPAGTASGDPGTWVSSPVVYDGVVYVADWNGTLHAYETSTGTSVWSVPGVSQTDPGPVVDGVLYTGGPDGAMHALDSRTGTQIWQTSLPNGPSRAASVENGMLFVGSGDGHVNALNTADGSIAWSVDIGGGVVRTIVVASGIVFSTNFTAPSPVLIALDAQTGAERWRFQSPENLPFQVPVITDGVVYAANGNMSVYALDRETGALKSESTLPAEASSAPAAAGAMLYVNGADGVLYGIDRTSGIVVSTLTLTVPQEFGPSLAPQIVVVATRSGAITAILEGEAAPVPDESVAAPATVNSLPPVSWVWSAGGTAENPVHEPALVSIDPDGHIWIANLPGNFVIFDLDGNLLESWGSSGTGDGQFVFETPEVVAGSVDFAPDGSFYVADLGNSRVQQFDRDRNFVRSWGTRGDGDGQFRAPGNVDVDTDGTVWVSDFLRGDVQQFTADGTFIQRIDPSGDANIINAGAVTIAPDGRVWISDYHRNRFVIFERDGTFHGVLGGVGSSPEARMQEPWQVAFDSAGNAFVADQLNHVVKVFNPAGQFVYEFGGFGTADGKFDTPPSLVVYRDKTIIVLDWHNDRIQKFRVTGPFPPPSTAGTPVP